MTQRDIPENWSPSPEGEPDDMISLSPTPQFAKIQAFGVSVNGSTSKSVNQQQQDSYESPLHQQSAPTSLPGQKSGKYGGWTKNWFVWGLILTLIPGSIGFLAMRMLLRLPSSPTCTAVSRPFVSASVRLYCAQKLAAGQNVDDLLGAIALVSKISEDHPLGGEINRFITEWSQDILRLSNESFQSGDLAGAIATVRRIPKHLAAYKLVDEQVAKWESIWSQAEGIYNQVERELRQRRWQSASMLAAKLIRVDNQYWSGVKYNQLNNLIISTKEDGEKLANAERLANTKVQDNLLEAIKLSESLKPESYLYQQAQELIPEIGRKMLELAQASLDRRDASTALDIARQIPDNAQLQVEVQDFITLTDAKRSAWIGTVSGLETAIFQAQQVDASRAIYGEAQALIANWEVEIQDVARLETARTIASQGRVEDLRAAIGEAQLVSANSARASEARTEINRWRNQVETIEDRPILERAEQLVWRSNDINALQAAISEARQIREGRALYSEAQRRIRQWTATIERIQDQPYLDRARMLAQGGNLNAAINTIQPIASSRRSLSGEARNEISNWQRQIRARENWTRAQQVAGAGTPEALSQAIAIANRVPRSSTLRMDVNFAVNQWSQQLLTIANSQSNSNLARAIETARLIPRGSSAYNAAQQQIKNWQQLLNPEPPPFEPIVPIVESSF
jgi:hypothetical protein